MPYIFYDAAPSLPSTNTINSTTAVSSNFTSSSMSPDNITSTTPSALFQETQRVYVELFLGPNFNASRTVVVDTLAKANITIFPQYFDAAYELTKVLSPTPTPEQIAAFPDKLQTFLTKATESLLAQPGLENFYNDPVILTDPQNQELLSILSMLDSESKKINATNAYLFFNAETVALMAKSTVLMKQASDRAVAAKSGYYQIKLQCFNF